VDDTDTCRKILVAVQRLGHAGQRRVGKEALALLRTAHHLREFFDAAVLAGS
jgi:hypothetical protein